MSLGSGSRAHSSRTSSADLIGLGVLEAVPLQPRHGEAQQRRPLAAADMGDGAVDQPGRLGRLGAVAGEDGEIGEARQIPGDVAARGLEGRGHGDAEAVVLDVEEHRQLLGGGDGQRRPEAVGGAGGVAAEHHRDRAVIALVAEHRPDNSRIACAQPAVGVYCAPTPPDIGSAGAPFGLG